MTELKLLPAAMLVAGVLPWPWRTATVPIELNDRIVIVAAAGRRYACCAFADGFAVLVDLHRHLNRGHAPMHATNKH